MRTGVSPKRIATRILSLLRKAKQKASLFAVREESLFWNMKQELRSCLFPKFCHKGLPLQQSVLWPVWFPILVSWQINSNTTPTSSSLERRWSSRTFRYGYLVTTSPQLSDLPSTALSLRLRHWLRAFPTPMVWRAVCTRPGNVFTATFWFAITSDSSFM